MTYASGYWDEHGQWVRAGEPEPVIERTCSKCGMVILREHPAIETFQADENGMMQAEGVWHMACAPERRTR